jgi:hypothetical protein
VFLEHDYSSNSFLAAVVNRPRDTASAFGVPNEVAAFVWEDEPARRSVDTGRIPRLLTLAGLVHFARSQQALDKRIESGIAEA